MLNSKVIICYTILFINNIISIIILYGIIVITKLTKYRQNIRNDIIIFISSLIGLICYVLSSVSVPMSIWMFWNDKQNMFGNYANYVCLLK